MKKKISSTHLILIDIVVKVVSIGITLNKICVSRPKGRVLLRRTLQMILETEVGIFTENVGIKPCSFCGCRFPV